MLRGNRKQGLLQGERNTDIFREKRLSVRREEERPCQSEGDCDGRLVLDAELEWLVHIFPQFERVKESLQDLDILPDDKIEVFLYEDGADIAKLKIYRGVISNICHV